MKTEEETHDDFFETNMQKRVLLLQATTLEPDPNCIFLLVIN